MIKKDYSIYIERRKKLINLIKEKYGVNQGVVILFGAFEHERFRFRQDSTLYYFSGLIEPGMVMLLDLAGGHDKISTMVYLAQYKESRNKWVISSLYDADKKFLELCGITDIQYLGQPCSGYSITASCTPAEYEYFIKVLKDHIKQGHKIFTTYANSYINQKLLIERLTCLLPELNSAIVDISSIIASLRRTKSKAEIELIYNAIDCTMNAQESAAMVIEPKKFEYEVQAALEFVFTQSGGFTAFPSIVASGANSTILHYHLNNREIEEKDLVVVDIGAEIEYYCADLTRTYPASGKFTKRQREVYEIVLETQRYIESLAKPGIWLNNKDKPKESLHHLATEYLTKKGFGKYFTHGIGHFLGLDVHDVGNYSDPLAEGDVITIEPGIYIPEEKIGIRIEDDYWIIKDGVICLSEDLPKDPEIIEQMMEQEFE